MREPSAVPTVLPGANDASIGASLLKATRLDVGGLAVGQWGDTIAVAGDPLADTTLLQAIPVVIKGGVLVKDTRR